MDVHRFSFGTSGDSLLSDAFKVPDPEYPVIHRFNQSSTASEAVIAALQSYYAGCWREKIKSILRESESKYQLIPSRDAAVVLLGTQMADEVTTRQPAKLAANGRASPKDITASQQDDVAVAAVIKEEELFFYQQVLPSRFLDDYVLYVALADGSLPSQQVGSATSSQPYSDQLHDAIDSASQRILRPGDLLRSHPKMTFPFSLAVHYKPTKKSRTVNDIIRRSSSVVFDAKGGSGGPRRSIATLDDSVRHVLSSLSSDPSKKPLQVVSDAVKNQAQPKTMIDDESAARRGFTVLPFLPPLLSENAQRMETSAIQKAKQMLATTAASTSTDPLNGSTSSAAAVDLSELDVTVESLMKKCGLTEYDAARFGSGSIAAQSKDYVVQQSTVFASEEIRRRREENVLRLEREQAQRDKQTMQTAQNRELTLREQFIKQEQEQRLKAAKSVMDKIREVDAYEVQKHSRKLQAEQLVKEFRAEAKERLLADAERQARLHQDLEETLREKTWRRLYDTTLDGEREKAAALARQRGALSTSLAEFRPKLKQLDQVARQDNILRSTVHELDSRCGNEHTVQDTTLKKSQQDRKWHDTLVAEQQIVRAADADAHKNKTQDRSLRVADRQRHAELLKRDHAEVNVMRLVQHKPLKDYFDERTVENSAEIQNSFEQWRAERRNVHEVALAKRELHMHSA